MLTSKHVVLVLALVSFTGILSQFALSPLLPVVADDVGTTVPLLAQTITASLIVSALLALVIGPFADSFGHRRVLLIGSMLVVASAVGTALAVDYWSVLIMRLPGGIGGGIMAAIPVVLASTRFPARQRRWAIGWTVSGISATPIVGMPAVAFVGDQLGWQASFLTLGLLGAVCFILLYRAIEPDPVQNTERFRLINTLNAYRPVLASQLARRFQISNLFRAIGWGAALTYLSAYLVDVHDLSLTSIGYLFFITGVGYFLGARLGDGRYQRFSLRTLFAISTGLMGMMLAVLFIIDANLWVLVPPLVIGVTAGGVGFVALTILISEESPSYPATAMMMRQSGFSLGLAGGAVVGGLALALGGYNLLGVVILAFAITSSALLLLRQVPVPDSVLPEPQIAADPVATSQVVPTVETER